MRNLGDQLRQARERAGFTNKSEFGRRVGWKDNTNVIRVEAGGTTNTDDLVRWVEECKHELLVVPVGSTESVTARVNDADERERRLAADLLDLLRACRTDMPGVLDYFENDLATWRAKLQQRRQALDAS